MISIFYNSKNNGTLIINLSLSKSNKIVENDSYTLIYNDYELIGINIFNIDNYLKITSSWVYPSDDILKLVQKLTNVSGLKHDPQFIVANVLECENIPNTHLHKCILTDGKEQYDVVCGAKNITSGINVVFAKSYSLLPNGKFILFGELMGYKSSGMICSAKELNLAKESNGILILDDSYKVGSEFKDIYK